MPSLSKTTKSALLIGTALSLCSCSASTLSGRYDLALKAASSANMQEQTLAAPPFLLTAFTKVNNIGAPTRLYIEGDGLAWLSRTEPSLNPTPTEPIALELASKDSAANVIYLARPCQYTGRVDGSLCEIKYWMGSRYAPEVLKSYHQALDQLKARYHISSFDLVGFSGGATVAALLAGQRSDIGSLRSVAGNLDHREHSRVHEVSLLGNSLNPPQYAQELSRVPQYHFIGGDDKIVPRSIYDRYSAAMPGTDCTQYKIVDGASHASGWVERWPELLRLTPRCL